MKNKITTMFLGLVFLTGLGFTSKASAEVTKHPSKKVAEVTRHPRNRVILAEVTKHPRLKIVQVARTIVIKKKQKNPAILI
jgi:hypothetical protein